MTAVEPRLGVDSRTALTEALRRGPLRTASREYRDFPSAAARKAAEIADALLASGVVVELPVRGSDRHP